MSELNDTQIEEDHENDESTPLLISQIPKKSFFRRHKRCSIFCLVAFFVILAVALTIYFGYYHGIVTLKVFAFNVWGMPGGLGGCKYKKERMIALANVIQSGTPYFDILLMEELWMEADHSTLANASKQAGFYMTEFRELASSLCDGRVLITECSGLAIISRHPIKEAEFTMYTWKGTIWDGEDLAGKGVGRVRIEPMANTTVDVFVTHTIADSGTKMANNTWYRVKQVEELMESHVKKSTADAVILGGDFNSPPKMEPGEPYEIVQRFMKNSAEEIFSKLKEWLMPKFATYGNQRNSFSYMYDPTTYDYIFHKSMSAETLTWTNWFELPFLQALIEAAQKEVSITLSDHEPVISTIYVRKRSSKWPYL